jgi:hypothetical protein
VFAITGNAGTDWIGISAFVAAVCSGAAVIIGALNHRQVKSPNGTKTGNKVDHIEKDLADVKSKLGIDQRENDVSSPPGG